MKLGGIAGVHVDLATGRVSYRNPGTVQRERIADAIRQAGFEPQ